MQIPFEEVGRLPFEDDNVAIATRDLEAGLEIKLASDVIRTSHSVLEGHRFAIQRIDVGDSLLSWGMPFGRAVRLIYPGDYVCNEGVVEALLGRNLEIQLPGQPNFSDEIVPYTFNAGSFTAGKQVKRMPVVHYFEGYLRSKGRGVGTRNHILILGVSSRVSAFVRHLERVCADVDTAYDNVDGIVGVSHTEGDDTGLNNRGLVLRTLAGFIVHPNTGAVLLVDDGKEAITGQDVIQFMNNHDYPAKDVLIRSISLEGKFREPLSLGLDTLKAMLPEVNGISRTPQPISELKIALQCGGSDAFSGISGNPLAGWIAKEVIQQGGCANLAETDELVGAEAYILKNVRSKEVADRFLSTIKRFIERAERHGSSAAGNPSGGNKFRGLYNIYLKSLGAAMKKHPEVCLDAVIEYGELMDAPGYYFMDSPGNDLESVAGQVASGCNLIYFVTGNGSITNFPFVPTVKIVTTTRRYDLLEEDMDVNAGLYLDGTAMADLGASTMRLTLDIASGVRSAGEKAGHSQVQLWRNWRQPDSGNEKGKKSKIITESLLSGAPLSLNDGKPLTAFSVQGYASTRGPAFERLGLVLPTSLCAGQVARMAVDMLNAQKDIHQHGIDRFVTLVHTEGCGASSGSSEEIFMRTMSGHLIHPNVKKALLLEHGCEKTHNDFFKQYTSKHNISTENVGWASIQLGGGIQNTLQFIASWFLEKEKIGSEERKNFGAEAVKLGIFLDPKLESEWGSELTMLVSDLVMSGGSIVLLEDHMSETTLVSKLGIEGQQPTLAYAQAITSPGLHIMNSSSQNWQEIITGLGATGINIILYIGEDLSRPGHPFIPVVQVPFEITGKEWCTRKDRLAVVYALISKTLNGLYRPMRREMSNLDFQVTRGLFGISL